LDLSAYRFTQSHEWCHPEDGSARVGITDYAQSQLGDVIYVELPAVGSEVAAGAKFGVIESVKAASDLYSPVGGKVLEVNADLSSKPELINTDPYAGGWMLRLELPEPPSSELLDEAAYQRYVAGL
jgi:glycine cleavage system H protein